MKQDSISIFLEDDYWFSVFSTDTRIKMIPTKFYKNIWDSNRTDRAKITHVGNKWSVYLDTDQASTLIEFGSLILNSTISTNVKYFGFYFVQMSLYKHSAHYA